MKNEMEDKIKKWWRSPKEFSAAFAGATTVKNALFFEKNVDISYNKLIKILHEIPQYIMKVREKKIICTQCISTFFMRFAC